MKYLKWLFILIKAAVLRKATYTYPKHMTITKVIS